MRLLKKISDTLFLRFLIIGGLNTVFGYLIFCFFTFITKNAYTSIVLSTISGVLFNFKTYGNLVFNSKDNSRIVRFFAAYGFVIAAQMVFLKWLNSMGILNPYVAVAIMVLPMAGLSFILMRKFVFHASFIPEAEKKLEDEKV